MTSSSMTATSHSDEAKTANVSFLRPRRRSLHGKNIQAHVPVWHALLVSFLLLSVWTVRGAVNGTNVWTGAAGDLTWSTPGNWEGGAAPSTNDYQVYDMRALAHGSVVTQDVPACVKTAFIFAGNGSDIWTLTALTGVRTSFAACDFSVSGGTLVLAGNLVLGSQTEELSKSGDGELRFERGDVATGGSFRFFSLKQGRVTLATTSGLPCCKTLVLGGELCLETDSVLAGLSTERMEPALLPPVRLNGHRLRLVGCDSARIFAGELTGTGDSGITYDRGGLATFLNIPAYTGATTLYNADLTLGVHPAVFLDFEDAGNPRTDTLGAGARLAVVGSPEVVNDAERGAVCKFNGSSYLKGGDSNGWLNGMPSGNSPFTVAFWFKMDPNLSGNAAIFSWGNPSLDNFVGIRVDNGMDILYAWYGTNFKFNKDLKDGAWHHVLVTFNGAGTLTFYLDGVPQGECTGRNENITPKQFFVGTGGWGGGIASFKGWIDDFVVLPLAVTGPFVPQLMARGTSALRGSLPEGAAVNLERSGTLTLNCPARLGTIAGAGLLGGIALQDGKTLTVSGAGVATSTVYEATLRGNVSLVKDGADYELVLSGANSYTGTTTVAAGTLAVRTPVSQPGLCAYWDFEDASFWGRDRSAKGYNLDTNVKAGITPVADGVLGQAAHFDGSKSASLRSNTVRPAEFPKENDPFTCTVWVRPNSSSCSGKCPVLQWGNGGLSNNHCVMLRFDGSSTLCFIKTGSEDLRDISRAGVRFDDGAWHHIAIMSDGVVQSAWIDGVLAKSARLSTPLQVSGVQGTVRIGEKTAGGSGFYTGDLDEVRIFRRALSADEILAEYEMRRPTGTDPVADLPQPVAHWTFDDAAAPGRDSGPYGSDLEVVGKVSVTSNQYTWGGALDLRNGFGYLRSPAENFPEHVPTGNLPMTVSCRVCPNASADYNGSVVYWGDSSVQRRYFMLAINQDAHSRSFKLDFGSAVLTSGFWGTETSERARWMHLVAVYEPAGESLTGRRLRFYIDGVRVEASNLSTDRELAAMNFFIGRKQNNPTVNFQGLIDDVCIFDAALSDGEVRTLVRAHAGEVSPLPPSSPVAIADSGELKIASAAAACGALSGAGTLRLASESRLTVTADSAFDGALIGSGAMRAKGCAVTLNGDASAFDGTLESCDGGRIVALSALPNDAVLVGGSRIEIADPEATLPLIETTGAGRVEANGSIVWANRRNGVFTLMTAADGFPQKDVDEVLTTWRFVPPNANWRMRLLVDGTSLRLGVFAPGTVVLIR